MLKTKIKKLFTRSLYFRIIVWPLNKLLLKLWVMRSSRYWAKLRHRSHGRTPGACITLRAAIVGRLVANWGQLKSLWVGYVECSWFCSVFKISGLVKAMLHCSWHRVRNLLVSCVHVLLLLLMELWRTLWRIKWWPIGSMDALQDNHLYFQF